MTKPFLEAISRILDISIRIFFGMFEYHKIFLMDGWETKHGPFHSVYINNKTYVLSGVYNKTGEILPYVFLVPEDFEPKYFLFYEVKRALYIFKKENLLFVVELE